MGIRAFGVETMTQRQGRLLTGPILPTLFGLAGPTLVVLLVQTGVGVAETYFVSNLGTAALAGVTLVFPALMLMQMMSNGGIGGGVPPPLPARSAPDAMTMRTHWCCTPSLLPWCWA